MNIVKRIIYRWQNYCDALPGEVEPVYYDGHAVRVSWRSKPQEVEPIELLRHLRGLIGYGQGWTFRDAFWHWVYPGLVVLVSGAAILLLAIGRTLLGR